VLGEGTDSLGSEEWPEFQTPDIHQGCGIAKRDGFSET
jgi:hypothetical protein